jgi:hypothetical protein
LSLSQLDGDEVTETKEKENKQDGEDSVKAKSKNLIRKQALLKVGSFVLRCGAIPCL